jgi:hypothetical protein
VCVKEKRGEIPRKIEGDFCTENQVDAKQKLFMKYLRFPGGVPCRMERKGKLPRLSG